MLSAGHLRNRARIQTLKALGPQLGRQHGPFGGVAASALNRLHRDVIITSVEKLDPAPGTVVADIGFGGGLGLERLLLRVGTRGTVHGVEITDLTIRRAGRRFQDAVRDGRLQLHKTAVDDLPLQSGLTRGAVDGLMTVNTVHHFDDLDAAVAGMTAVLAPGGRLVVAFPDPSRQQHMPMTQREGHHLRPIAAIESAVERAGLHLRSTEPVGAYIVILADSDVQES